MWRSTACCATSGPRGLEPRLPEPNRHGRVPDSFRRRRLHLPPGPLSHDEPAALRALLPLPLVPARDRHRVRPQRDDRSRSGAVAGGRARGRRHAVGERQGQRIWRCPACRVAVWSNYAGAGDAVRFIRVGTLDEPDRFPPEVHIFTASKQPWVLLPPATPAVAEYYKASELWPAESLVRRAALQAKAAR